MTDTKKKTKRTKDQAKVGHRQEFKGHRTKKHYLDSIEKHEAERDIREEKGNK